MNEAELFDLRRSLETIRDIIMFFQKDNDGETDDNEKNSQFPTLCKLAEDIMVFPQLTSTRTVINGRQHITKSELDIEAGTIGRLC